MVAEEITVRIASSPSMQVINQNLKTGFETHYQGQAATVIISQDIVDTDAALMAVLEGSVDLAAIGRPVTQEEDAKGLMGVEISREKIAIIVGPNNPFTQAPFPNDLTAQEFAQIFRGEITNWEQVGGMNAPIRFIDRPENSDIRQTLSQYEVFKAAEFATGSNAVRVAEDDTAAIVRQLGRDGISYAIASQVIGQENVQVVPMHSILPNDNRYPFSQPRGYVYKQDPERPNASVDAFLKFATDPVGGEAVKEAKTAEAAGVATADIPAGVVAVSPQESLLATAGRDGYLQLRNFQGDLKEDPIKAHTGPITAISFSPDGQTIATSGADGVVKLWNPQGEELLEQPLAGHKGPIAAVAFSPVDGQFLVSGGQDGTLHFWNLGEEEKSGRPIPAHPGGLRSLAFSPDGQLIATGGADQAVRLWDLNGDPVGPLMTGHNGAVTAIAFSPDPQTSPNPQINPAPQADSDPQAGSDPQVGADSQVGSDPQAGSDSQTSPEPPIPAGSKLVSGSEDQTLRLWSVSDESTGQPIGQPFEGLQGPVTSVAFSPDGQTIISGSESAPLSRWNLKGEPIGDPFADQSAKATKSVSFGPDGQTLVSSTADGVPMFLTSDGQPINQLPQAPESKGEGSIDDWVESLGNQSPGTWGFGLVLLTLLGYITWWLFGDREWKEPKLEEVRSSQKSIDVSQTTEEVVEKQAPSPPSETPALQASDFDQVDFSTVSAEDFSAVSSEDFSAVSSEDFSTVSSEDFATGPSEESAVISAEDAVEDIIPPPPTAPEAPSPAPAPSSKLVQAKKALLEGVKLARAGRYNESLDQLQLAIEAADVERVKASLSGASLVGATALLASGMARRGSILAKLNRSDEAIVSLDKAVELEPDSMTVLARKARALKDTGRAKEAQICLKQAAKLKSENTRDPVRLAEESILPKRPQVRPNANAAASPSKGDAKGQPPQSKTTKPAPLGDQESYKGMTDKVPAVPPPPPPKLPDSPQPKTKGAVPANNDSEDIPADVRAAFESIPSQISTLDEPNLIEDASPEATLTNVVESIPASEESRAPVDWPDTPEILDSDSTDDIPPEVLAAFKGIPPDSPDAFG